jgi:predicted O-methyltransferase YrrM
VFSLDSKTIDLLLRETYPSYQATSPADGNLGFGFLFYAFTRLARPQNVIVIGSKAGFSVISFALALKDNAGTLVHRVQCYDTELIHSAGRGTVHFVDPSYSEQRGDPGHWHGIGFWDDPERVKEHWDKFGVADYIHHYKTTSSEFLHCPDCPREVDLLYIDGDHSREGVRHDFEQYHAILRADALILAHDVDPALKNFDPGTGGYEALTSLDPHKFEVCRLPIFPGMAIVRRK